MGAREACYSSEEVAGEVKICLNILLVVILVLTMQVYRNSGV